MDINYSVEQTEKMLAEAYLLARDHYKEVESKADKVDFNLDLNYMSQLVEAGLIYSVMARDGEKLIGYFCCMLCPDFMTQLPLAKEVGIYVDPAYRGQGVYKEMLQLAEEAAADRDAYCLILAFKEGHDTGEAIELGYGVTETLYQKLL
tara:strand:+ start:430 stop:876 length:447 start_codon:yes stop_codon:yes gene_type:complete